MTYFTMKGSTRIGLSTGATKFFLLKIKEKRLRVFISMGKKLDWGKAPNYLIWDICIWNFLGIILLWRIMLFENFYKKVVMPGWTILIGYNRAAPTAHPLHRGHQTAAPVHRAEGAQAHLTLSVGIVWFISPWRRQWRWRQSLTVVVMVGVMYLVVQLFL